MNEDFSKRTKGEAWVVAHSWAETGIYVGDKRIALVKIDSAVTEENQDKYEAIMDANAAYLALAWNCHEGAVEALSFARQQLDHTVPGDCWATGPRTGDPIQDLIVCPGCAALAKIDAILAKAKG